MKTLYLECSMGAAGDMLTAALLELTDDRQAFIDRMNSLGLPGVHVSAEKSVKSGITGTHFVVTVNGETEESLDSNELETAENHSHDSDQTHHGHEHIHHNNGHSHTSVQDIEALIESLAVSDQVKANAKAVYAILADAESNVHGCPVSQIHFHEVGNIDAVADVVAVCLLMEAIAPDQIIASPVHVGSGHVCCMHGILPVPAPATALILKGVPSYGGKVLGELCTPTGAALLKHFVSNYGDRPVMKTVAVGYGMGKKDFEQVNCVRAFLGESEDQREPVTKLECNLDDMTGEDISFAMDQLFRAGARDVYTQPINMKKNRPAVMLSVICMPDDADRLAEIIMKHTSTLGIRRQDISRYVLDRYEESVSTVYGDVRVKRSSGMGVEKAKPEYEDIARLAEENNISLEDVRREIKL